MTEHKKQISLSVMCADFMNFGKCIRTFEENQIEYLHVDIMDGSFVPNFTLGTDFCKALKRATDIPLDIHLMIDTPEVKLDWFDFGAGDYVSIHYESTKHLQKALAEIRKRGAKAMVALNPATPIESLKWVLSDIDGVLLMTVNPGFSGQKLVEQCIEKITELRSFLDSHGFQNVEIEVDGNVSFENAKRMSCAGADIFVAGTSSVFNPNIPMKEAIEKLRDAVK